MSIPISHDMLHVLHVLEALHEQQRDTPEAITNIIARLSPADRQTFEARYIKPEAIRETLLKVMAHTHQQQHPHSSTQHHTHQETPQP